MIQFKSTMLLLIIFVQIISFISSFFWIKKNNFCYLFYF